MTKTLAEKDNRLVQVPDAETGAWLVTWTPTTTILTFRTLIAEVDARSLPNESLVRLAERHSPPDSWWDSTFDPFEPEGG